MVMPKGHVRIKRPQDIRRLLGRVINELNEDEELEKIKKAKTIGYLSSICLTAMKEGELEERMNEIEKQLAEFKEGRK